MSQDRVFSLIGDSNVHRNMNSTNCRDRPLMSDAQVIPCGRLSVFAKALRQVHKISNIVVMFCITNFITGSEEAGSSIAIRVEPVFKEFYAAIESEARGSSNRLYLIAPPM